MTEYQVTYWRDLPTMVSARAGDDVAKAALAARFQEAVDEAAMRLGETGAGDYLAGWRRGEWTATEGSPQDAVDRIATDLDDEWTTERLAAYLNGLGTPG